MGQDLDGDLDGHERGLAVRFGPRLGLRVGPMRQPAGGHVGVEGGGVRIGVGGHPPGQPFEPGLGGPQHLIVRAFLQGDAHRLE